MTTLQFGITLVVLGLVLTLGAWTFLRKEEHDFFTFAPFTEAHHYLKPPGGTIWWTGIAVLCVGIFNCWAG